MFIFPDLMFCYSDLGQGALPTSAAERTGEHLRKAKEMRLGREEALKKKDLDGDQNMEPNDIPDTFVDTFRDDLASFFEGAVEPEEVVPKAVQNPNDEHKYKDELKAVQLAAKQKWEEEKLAQMLAEKGKEDAAVLQAEQKRQEEMKAMQQEKEQKDAALRASEQKLEDQKLAEQKRKAEMAAELKQKHEVEQREKLAAELKQKQEEQLKLEMAAELKQKQEEQRKLEMAAELKQKQEAEQMEKVPAELKQKQEVDQNALELAAAEQKKVEQLVAEQRVTEEQIVPKSNEVITAAMDAGSTAATAAAVVGSNANQQVQLPADLASIIMATRGTPAVEEPEPQELMVTINSSSHRPAAMRLKRFMEGNEADKFPHMSALFQGSKAEAQIV